MLKAADTFELEALQSREREIVHGISRMGELMRGLYRGGSWALNFGGTSATRCESSSTSGLQGLCRSTGAFRDAPIRWCGGPTRSLYLPKVASAKLLGIAGGGNMLENEIKEAQRHVKTDAYQLSISEVVNMYRDGELIINPDFQRLFRWELGQKSKLIESLLLGIPLPSIFVFEKEDSKWELIDGLQRISTILEFMGQLRNPANGQPEPPTALVATKYLPSLDKAVWEISDRIHDVPPLEQEPLSPPLQLAIRRSRLSVEILKRPSDNATKYDLFQRLNAGGIAANPQELRNVIIIMVSPAYAAFMRDCANSQHFLHVLSASEDQLEKQRHMEYVSRFFVHTYVAYDGKLDVEEFINEGIVRLASQAETLEAGRTFNDTFRFLDEAYGDSALTRFANGAPTGRVGLAAFEAIAIGVAKNIENIRAKPNPVVFVRQRINEFWEDAGINQFFVAGLRGTVRIQRTIPFGTAWFAT
jgi:hypothetical protein